MVGTFAKVLFTTFTLLNQNIDETILRTVGRLAVSSNQAAASEFQIGAFGAIIVSDAAVAVGVTAIPGPVTDSADDGWFLYVPIVQAMEFGTGVGLHPNWATGYDFDSKARRRIQEGEQIAFMVENGSAAHAFEIAAVIRMLTMVSGT